MFSGKYQIHTEFGNSLLFKAGKSITRVEYVKHWLDDVTPLLQIHVGANQFVRDVYAPNLWKRRFDIYSKVGTKKLDAKNNTYDIAGPLCFQGDYLAKNVKLPKTENGDWLIIHDTGAYGMVLYSKFNSILASPVYGFKRGNDGDEVIFTCFKRRETAKESLAFWGLETPEQLE